MRFTLPQHVPNFSSFAVPAESKSKSSPALAKSGLLIFLIPVEIYSGSDFSFISQLKELGFEVLQRDLRGDICLYTDEKNPEITHLFKCGGAVYKRDIAKSWLANIVPHNISGEVYLIEIAEGMPIENNASSDWNITNADLLKP